MNALDSALAARTVSCQSVRGSGYGTSTAKWTVELDDGRLVFVKHALTEEAEDWLRKERRVYEAVRGSFMPAYFGAYDEDECVFLVIEDLSGADWPPPWSSDRIEHVLVALEELRTTPPPRGLGLLEDLRDQVVGWPQVSKDTDPLLSTGVCSRPWLEAALPVELNDRRGTVRPQ